jgi:LPS export ABC transporter protein LptC
MIKRPSRLYQLFTRRIAPGILLALPFAACTNSMKEINDLTGQGKAGEDRGKDVTILYSKMGKMQVRMFAHTFIRTESPGGRYTEMKDGLKVEFFSDSATIKNTLTAKYARWYERENNILIRDSVCIINDKGEKLETKELVWNQQLDKFFTEKPVKITTPTQTLMGTGMEASQDFSNYQIHNLTGQVKVEKSKMPGE